MQRDCLWLPSGIHLSYPACGCQFYDFDVYCDKFDEIFQECVTECGIFLEAHPDGSGVTEVAIPNLKALLETRKMMLIMLGCNTLYGMDGYIYEANGTKQDTEYLAVNQPLDALNSEGKPAFYAEFLSTIPRFVAPLE